MCSQTGIGCEVLQVLAIVYITFKKTAWFSGGAVGYKECLYVPEALIAIENGSQLSAKPTAYRRYVSLSQSEQMHSHDRLTN